MLRILARAALFAAPLLAAIAIACTSPREPVRVVVLGFDGANWDTIDPLLEEGRLPLLARLKEEAAWAPLRTFKPTKSPVIWTSIATGKPMEQHGILDFVYLEENDLQIPYSNSERREPSIWQILDYFGLRSIVVNWFVTYPPDAINGVMVSNRFRKAILLRENQRARLADAVHPPAMFDELTPFLAQDYGKIRGRAGLPELTETYRTLHPEENVQSVPVLKDYWVFVRQDALVQEISHHLFQTQSFDFFATYFRLPDIVQHTILELLPPEEVDRALGGMAADSLTGEDRKAFQRKLAQVMEPFYGYMEQIIQSYLEQSPENTYVIVVSDHGFTLHPRGYDHYHIPESYEAPSGIFIMAGPGVAPGRVAEVSVYDIAPTILHLFGLPVGDAMTGRPVTSGLTFARDTGKERYPRSIMSPAEGRRDAEIDERTLEELRSLGYIR